MSSAAQVPSMALSRTEHLLTFPGVTMPEFEAWFASKCDNADCVVALARAAPRLLQYYGLLERIKIPVVCERAIPFLSPDYFRNKSVLLFDDTIAFGSTMAATRLRLMKGGAHVSCLAIAVDKDVFLGEDPDGSSVTPSRYLEELSPDYLLKGTTHQLDILHGIELRAFRTMGKPYMFDFPIFEVSLRSYVREDTPRYIAWKVGETRDNPFLWSFAGGPNNKLSHFSIPIARSFLEQLFPDFSSFIDWQPFSKLRVFIDYANLTLRFIPLIQIDSKPKAIESALNEGKVKDPILQSMIATISKHVGLNELREMSFHRAVVFTLAHNLGAIAWKSLLSQRIGSVVIDKEPRLCISDAAFLMGGELAHAMGKHIAETVARCPQVEWQFSPEVDDGSLISYLGAPPSDGFSNPSLWEKVAAKLVLSRDARPSNRRSAFENISYIIPILNEVVDQDQRETGDISRLLRGLSYHDLFKLLNSYGAHATRAELSTALDEHIDGGILVPQLTVDYEKGLVKRVYRSGEGYKSDTTTVLKTIVRSLLSERDALPFPKLGIKGMEKSFVILKQLFPAMPYRIGPQTYGLEPFVENNVLRVWCEQHNVLTVADDGTVSLVDSKLESPEWPFDHSFQLQVRNAFEYLSELDGLPAAQKGFAPGLKMLLLLSTCNTHQATFNACAWEVHSWIRNERHSFDRFLSLLESLDWTKLSQEAQRVSTQMTFFATADEQNRRRRFDALSKPIAKIRLPNLLQLCRGYLSEYQIKHALFYDDFDATVASLEAHFSSDHHKRRFWEETFVKTSFFSGAKDPRFAYLFAVMDPIEKAAWRLMDVIESILVANEWWIADQKSDGGLDPATRVERAVKAYDDAILQFRSLRTGSSRAHLFERPASITDIPAWVSECRKTFVGLRDLFDLNIPIGDEFSVIPFSRTYRNSRNVKEDVLTARYIGMFDMIDSKLAPKEAKIEIASALDELGCLHEVTGDDAYVFVCNTYGEALETIDTVRTRTIQFYSPQGKGYGGIRVSLIKGDCIRRMLTNRPGVSMITDCEGKFDIAKAAYQMESIKKLLEGSTELSVDDQSVGVALDRETATEIGGSDDDAVLRQKRIYKLSRWTHKGLGGETYFFKQGST
jgi:hypothetical protein